MHVELLAPGLFAAAPLPRLPALELLAARGRVERQAPRSLERWLADAFEVGEGPLPAGALTALASGQSPGEACWLRADPLHLDVGPQGGSIVPAAALAIGRDEAERLVSSLNAHFGEAYLWFAARADAWCLRAQTELAVTADQPLQETTDPAGLLPQGASARRAHALVTEVQMLLHGHPVNQAREARGAATLNSVWLWGAGRLPRAARGPWQSVTSDHAVAAGLATLAGVPRHPMPPGGAARWLEQAPREGRHLCILDAAGTAAALETSWFAPLLAALRDERIGMLTLCVPDAGCRWETTRGDLRRFWRRARPLSAGA